MTYRIDRVGGLSAAIPISVSNRPHARDEGRTRDPCVRLDGLGQCGPPALSRSFGLSIPSLGFVAFANHAPPKISARSDSDSAS